MNVRTRLVLTCWVALVAILITAPAALAREGTGFGIKGGALYNKFDSDDFRFKGRFGFQGGLFVGGSRDNTVSIMVELNFLQKKGKGELTSSPTASLNYLDVPVFLRISAGTHTTGGVDLYFLVGPAFDFKVSETVGGTTVTDGFQGFDVGISGALGIELTRIMIEGRYTYGLRNINKNFTETTDLKSQSVALLFGLRFK